LKALLLPLDNRPVTCLLPQMVSRIAGIEAVVPPRHLLGALDHPASSPSLADWMQSELSRSTPDCLLFCLDSLLYGGLINARRSSDSFKQVLARTSPLKQWARPGRKKFPIFAQSSVMRISDNYDPSEEKAYWAEYGRELFAWSELLHRLSSGEHVEPRSLAAIELKIPADIRRDYLATRARNFRINLELLNLVASGVLDLLTLSLDDSGELGLNVLEKDRLVERSQSTGLSDRVLCYPGADEVLSSLLARWLVSRADTGLAASVVFSPPAVADCPSRYEGQSIGKTVAAQMLAQRVTESDNASRRADFVVIVHGAGYRQGDHIWQPGQPDLRTLETAESVRATIAALTACELPCVLCDVAYANGSDPLLVQALLEKPHLFRKLWGYAGWNTTGNTVGSALSMGVARWFSAMSKQPAKRTEEALRHCLFVRLADDWAYQAIARRKLSSPVDSKSLYRLMEENLRRIARALEYDPPELSVSLPWQRTFEIEVSSALEG